MFNEDLPRGISNEDEFRNCILLHLRGNAYAKAGKRFINLDVIADGSRIVRHSVIEFESLFNLPLALVDESKREAFEKTAAQFASDCSAFKLKWGMIPK